MTLGSNCVYVSITDSVPTHSVNILLRRTAFLLVACMSLVICLVSDKFCLVIIT